MQTNLRASERIVRKSRKLSLKNSERNGKMIVYTAAFLTVVATLAVTIFLTQRGLQSFYISDISPLEFFASTNWDPAGDNPTYGALVFIFGSLAVTLVSAIIVAPLGIGTAIFMTEIAPSWGKRVLQPVIEILVGIPSVIYGYIGLTVLVPFIREQVGGSGYSLMASIVVVSVMILPTVTTLSADALNRLPDGLRSSSYALGATRWQTIRRVLLPAAIPGLLTAVILGMARAIGEALAIQMVIGNTELLPGSLLDPTATMTTIITLNMGHTTFGSAENNVLWTLGLILLAISYLLVMAVRFLGARRKM
ncbi:phosphate ABC transporter permease subunit PstC [Salicibibacter cibarius]|uniref:Phosphate transport system permease protein n=1 Tax=Salicibibacter cibarius TaxID=2743000 RepID=A0A7T7CCU3_9BACI|nr:phosphate ABC transporter permease subunit PstC [Salicibibacter cibarius]QQK77270.1 phosphate ABC transporter permease subunit PstC [Salicibibacter cibarius]